MVPESLIERKKSAPALKHAHCTKCQHGPGEVTALCGAKKMVGRPVPRLGPVTVPAHACVVCADLLEKPCLLCGGSAY